MNNKKDIIEMSDLKNMVCKSFDNSVLKSLSSRPVSYPGIPGTIAPKNTGHTAVPSYDPAGNNQYNTDLMVRLNGTKDLDSHTWTIKAEASIEISEESLSRLDEKEFSRIIIEKLERLRKKLDNKIRNQRTLTELLKHEDSK